MKIFYYTITNAPNITLKTLYVGSVALLRCMWSGLHGRWTSTQCIPVFGVNE